MKIYLFNMNIVVDYETMAEGLHKALSSTDLKEQKAYKERMKWQFQDITISIETNPISQLE